MAVKPGVKVVVFSPDLDGCMVHDNITAMAAGQNLGECFMLQAVRQTFGSVWGWLGVIAGAIALTNLTTMYFAIGVGPVAELVLETYRSWVHPVFNFILSFFQWAPPDWIKDVAAIYIIFAAATFRAEIQYLRAPPDIFSMSSGLICVFFALLWPMDFLITLVRFLAADFAMVAWAMAWHAKICGS